MSLLRRRTMMLGQEEEMKEWKLLYDSGKIEEAKISFETADISGCEELYGIVLCMKNENAAGNRDLEIVITTQNGNYNFIIGKSLITASSNKSCEFHLERIADALSVDAFYNSNAATTDFDSGFSSNNNTNASSGYALNVTDLKSVKIRSLNALSGYEFGIGSRCRIYGR